MPNALTDSTMFNELGKEVVKQVSREGTISLIFLAGIVVLGLVILALAKAYRSDSLRREEKEDKRVEEERKRHEKEQEAKAEAFREMRQELRVGMKDLGDKIIEADKNQTKALTGLRHEMNLLKGETLQMINSNTHRIIAIETRLGGDQGGKSMKD